MNDNNLQHIWDAIAAPLDPSEIKFRNQSGTDIPYIDRTTVEMRLNSVCPGDWHFQVTPIVVPDGSKGQWVVKGTLTIHGVTREDFGMNDNENSFDPPKAAVSDALKRCAALFGLGRELAEDPKAAVAKAKGTQAGGRYTPPKASKAPQTPPAPASAAEPVVKEQSDALPTTPSDVTLPPPDAPMASLSGKALYDIQANAWMALNMNHPKHFENRWKQRYNVKNLKDIPGTFGDFMTIMAMEDEAEAA